MTPNELNEKELRQEVLRLNSVFYPREHWSDPSPLSKEDVRDLLIFMQVARMQGLLETQEELIDKHLFEHYPKPDTLPRRKRALWLVAARRHSKGSLKDETWSAVRYLCQRFPEERIEPYSNGLPYCRVVREEGIVITAGNVSPVVMVKFMLEQDVPQLGVVGEPTIDISDWNMEHLKDTGKLCLRWIRFNPKAFQALREHLAEKERELQRITEAALSAAFGGFAGLKPPDTAGIEGELARRKIPQGRRK